jgi:hypothetical protein
MYLGEPDEMWSVLRNPSIHCPWNADTFETPTHRVFLTFYTLLGLAFTAALIAYYNKPRDFERATFWLHFLITAVIRCVSSFSGFTTLHDWSSLIWNSNSGGKIVWLWLLVERGCWSWTYLGFYEDYYCHEDTRTVHDRVGRPVWTFTSEKTDDPVKDDIYNACSPIFLSWRDIAVRLSYVYLIDNTIHFIWFRYFIADAPYTLYLDNSEILTMLLFVILALYTYARTITHVFFNDNEIGLLVDIKNPIPLPTSSATRDLFTFCSPHHRFRTASVKRQIIMVVYCVLAACVIATWDIYGVFKFFWMCVAKFTIYAMTVELQGLQTPEEKMELQLALNGVGKYA